MNVKLFLQICLHLYGTRCRVALVLLLSATVRSVLRPSFCILKYFALALAVNEILIFSIFYLENWVKVTDFNFRNGAIRWQISKSIKVIVLHFIFVMIRPMITKVTHTHTHTLSEKWTSPGYRRNLADFPKNRLHFNFLTFPKKIRTARHSSKRRWYKKSIYVINLCYYTPYLFSNDITPQNAVFIVNHHWI